MTCASTPITAATEPCAHDAGTTLRGADPIGQSAGAPSSTCETGQPSTASSAPGSFSPASTTRRRHRGKWTAEQVIQRLRELADADGYAPSKDRWDEQRGDTLPSSYTITGHGYAWAHLVERAGLKRSPSGNRPGSKPPGKVHFQEKAIPEETEAFIRHAFATAEPYRPSTWPLFAVGLTRREEFVGRRPDGQYVRCVREYYSLR